MAAVTATFSDFKIIKTRKLVQIILELPIEEADAALAALGGLPRSDREKWVAIARLDLERANNDQHKERRAFCDLPMPNQAGIKSTDKTFQDWMDRNHFAGLGDNNCAEGIREYCGVSSRAEILPGTEAGERWLNLLNEFEGIRNE